MGKGSIHYDTAAQRYFINLAVMAKYNSNALGHKLRWQRSFEFASSILFDATNGQMQFGEIYFIDAGTPTSDEDIFLENLPGDSLTTVMGHDPFCGQIILKSHVMNEPLVTIHEIGHYVVTLGDEYEHATGVCQNDPTTHQCIMEFGSGYGLRLDDSGNVTAVQPQNVVNQFCFCDHPHVPPPLPTPNGQETKHRQSCWETLHKLYPLVALPSGTSVPSTLQPVQWIELSTDSRYAILIHGDPLFAAFPVEQAIKNAVKEWVNQVASTDNQLALSLGSSGTIRPMQPILPEEVLQLHKLIDATTFGKSGAQPNDFQKSIDQFDGKMTAYQRMILLTAGNTPDNVKALPKVLEQKRFGVLATTVGPGALADQFDELAAASKWVTQQNFPIPNSELSKYAFSLQNELIESYFANSPGSGIVQLRWGSLPSTQDAASEIPNPLQDEKLVQSLQLQLRDDGFDFPVWVEQDAHSLSFLLSEPGESQIDMSLLAPDGTTVPVPTRRNLPFHAFDRRGVVHGKWIVRLRRIKPGPGLPFFFIAAVNNHELRISTKIKIVPKHRVQFRLQAIHVFPIDYVEAVVDIIRLQPDEDNRAEVYKSVVLWRDRALDPVSQKMVEVSSGLYRGEVELESGSYIAIFRSYNYGQATYASNPDGMVGGNVSSHQQKPIPSFTRLVKHWFQVK